MRRGAGSARDEGSQGVEGALRNALNSGSTDSQCLLGEGRCWLLWAALRCDRRLCCHVLRCMLRPAGLHLRPRPPAPLLALGPRLRLLRCRLLLLLLRRRLVWPCRC